MHTEHTLFHLFPRNILTVWNSHDTIWKIHFHGQQNSKLKKQTSSIVHKKIFANQIDRFSLEDLLKHCARLPYLTFKKRITTRNSTRTKTIVGGVGWKTLW